MPKLFAKLLEMLRLASTQQAQELLRICVFQLIRVIDILVEVLVLSKGYSFIGFSKSLGLHWNAGFSKHRNRKNKLLELHETCNPTRIYNIGKFLM
jgi:hypothetical protein